MRIYPGVSRGRIDLHAGSSGPTYINNRHRRPVIFMRILCGVTGARIRSVLRLWYIHTIATFWQRVRHVVTCGDALAHGIHVPPRGCICREHRPKSGNCSIFCTFSVLFYRRKIFEILMPGQDPKSRESRESPESCESRKK